MTENATGSADLTRVINEIHSMLARGGIGARCVSCDSPCGLVQDIQVTLIDNTGPVDLRTTDQTYVFFHRPISNLASYGQPEALEAARASGFGLSIRCGSESAVVDLQIVANRSKSRFDGWTRCPRRSGPRVTTKTIYGRMGVGVAELRHCIPPGRSSGHSAPAAGNAWRTLCRGAAIRAGDRSRSTMSGPLHGLSVVPCESAGSGLQPSPVGTVAMCYKKPVPLLPTHAAPRRLCPVCGTVSYSREGIHPQCAERRADVLRMERVKADKKVDERKGKSANSMPPSYWHKRCPQCQAQLHIRKIACGCGYQFYQTR